MLQSLCVKLGSVGKPNLPVLVPRWLFFLKLTVMVRFGNRTYRDWESLKIIHQYRVFQSRDGNLQARENRSSRWHRRGKCPHHHYGAMS